MTSLTGLGMSEFAGVHRQWLLLRMLSRRGPGKTMQELAEEFGTCKRTIQRDFEVLGNVGFTFLATNGPHNRKTWRLDTDEILANLVFNIDELAALYFGRRLLEPLAGTFVWEAAQEAFKKIRAGLGPEKLRYLEQLAATFHHTPLGRSDYSDRDDVIEGLMTSISAWTAQKNSIIASISLTERLRRAHGWISNVYESCTPLEQSQLQTRRSFVYRCSRFSVSEVLSERNLAISETGQSE